MDRPHPGLHPVLRLPRRRAAGGGAPRPAAQLAGPLAGPPILAALRGPATPTARSLAVARRYVWRDNSGGTDARPTSRGDYPPPSTLCARPPLWQAPGRLIRVERDLDRAPISVGLGLLFFLKDPAPPEIYPLPHPAPLPI